MLCCVCGRRIKKAAAMRAAPNVLGWPAPIGPVGPVCARKVDVMPDAKPKRERAGSVRMLRAHRIVRMDDRQLTLELT